jgi:hypothetical protein
MQAERSSIHFLSAVAACAGLAVAATSPGYAAANTYRATDAIDAPPAETASGATTTAAAATSADKEATSTPSATAPRATTAASPASTTPATTAPAASTAASSGELNTGCQGTGSFRVKDVESGEAYVRDFFLAQKDLVAKFILQRCPVHRRIGRPAARKRQ